MADTKALADIASEQTTIADGDLFFVESGGTAAKITKENLKTALGIDDLESRPIAGNPLIATVTATAAADVVFDQIDDSLYHGYIVRFINVSSSVDSDELYMQTSSDGGTTFNAAAYNWSEMQVTDLGAVSGGGATADTRVQIGGNLRTAQKDFNGRIEFHNPESTTSTCTFSGQFSYTRNTGLSGTSIHARVNGPTTIVDAVRFYASSGTLTGTFLLQGILK